MTNYLLQIYHPFTVIVFFLIFLFNLYLTSQTDSYLLPLMGTPAFPNLGKHCSVDDCRLIDFLPFTCDCCQQVFCLEHRSYSSHECPKANKNNITVVICPLCAKGVPLIPEEDPNITWESHANIDCDPSNYEQATKKRKCPVPGCREKLTFSNRVKCRDCMIEHCLKHRLGLDHKCPGPERTVTSFDIISSLDWKGIFSERAFMFTKTASTVWTTAKTGMTRLSSEVNQTCTMDTDAQNCDGDGIGSGEVESFACCSLSFRSWFMWKSWEEHSYEVV